MFIWNGISSDDMGVKVISLPPVSLSAENTKEITIEGRDGFLTEFKGYSGETKKVEADYFGDDPYSICSWLRGNGEVTFSNEEGFYYKARISNQIPLEQIIKNQMYNFLIQFRCQPFKYFISGRNKNIINSNGTILNNFGNHKALPIITIYGSGNITININGRAFILSNLYDSITIASEIEEVLDGKGKLMEGDFPYFDPGKNIISWSGNVTKIEVTPNWRVI
ncbi:phage tail protein [Clostridium saccharoperbutylacetonicum]